MSFTSGFPTPRRQVIKKKKKNSHELIKNKNFLNPRIQDTLILSSIFFEITSDVYRVVVYLSDIFISSVDLF